MEKTRTWTRIAVVAIAILAVLAAFVAVEFKWSSTLLRIIAGVHLLPLLTILVQLGAGAWIGRK